MTKKQLMHHLQVNEEAAKNQILAAARISADPQMTAAVAKLDCLRSTITEAEKLGDVDDDL